MPKMLYKSFRFRQKTLDIIVAANEIIHEYSAKGYDLTLRQLYYQFVARDLLANNERNYNRLGGIINDARLAGLIDWTAIEDRTRNVQSNTHWDNPSSIIQSAASQYKIDKWEGQDYRIEIWIEKDALVGVIRRVCWELDVPYFSCRGYVSSSEMWRGAQRFIRWENKGYKTAILHLGDHDPSGIDMTRDIKDRMRLFGSDVEVHRIALTMQQIERFNPPPNFAKLSDSRCASYIARYGDKSWELDALDPEFMSELVMEKTLLYRDELAWALRVKKEKEEKAILLAAAKRIKNELEGNE